MGGVCAHVPLVLHATIVTHHDVRLCTDLSFVFSVCPVCVRVCLLLPCPVACLCVTLTACLPCLCVPCGVCAWVWCVPCPTVLCYPVLIPAPILGVQNRGIKMPLYKGSIRPPYIGVLFLAFIFRSENQAFCSVFHAFIIAFRLF